MAFIRNGTALAYYYPNIGLRIWEVADLAAEHRHSDGYELIVQAVTDGRVMGQDDELLFWPLSSIGKACMYYYVEW